MLYEDIKNNKEIKEFIRKGNQNLAVMGYTDHSEERIIIMSAIGNHDDSTGGANDPVSAALIIGDKTDVRRSRVKKMMCRGAAELLGGKFKLTANGCRVL